jgi:phenylpyruvate tautomerase PptA (4-oxalocrotonate tautomerase family)
MELEIPKALLDDKTFFCRLIEECRKDIDHSGVNSRGNEYFPAALLELVMECQQQQHTEIVDTILDNMSKTLQAQSSSTVVILCHRSVKSAMIKADEEDYKEQKEVFGKFIGENKFYYNDRFLKQYKYKSR